MPILFIYIYIKYVISKHILLITFLNEPELFYSHPEMVSNILFQTQIILFTTDSDVISSIAI